MKESRPRVIVSPLNWGLGHASRCIPLIRALQRYGFEPVLSGDGKSFDLLSGEFPALRRHDLPPYDIRYSKSPDLFKFKLALQGPGLLKTISREHEEIERIVEEEGAVGIISDNRFGAYSSKVPSVYLTHQLQVRAGWMSRIATDWHQRVISRFDCCWVCDYGNGDTLAGVLSSAPVRTKKIKTKKVKWIGPLSRFSSSGEMEKDVDIAVILSGPEPLRSLFQNKVIEELKASQGNLILVEGLLAPAQTIRKENNLTIYNYMLSEELESLIRRSRLVISRSGYSSIMDLHALGAKALLVPTPGQTEQEYLADRLKEKGICHSVSQAVFSTSALKKAEQFSGFETKKTSKNEDLKSLFDVFK